MYTQIDQSVITEYAAQDNVQLNGLTKKEFVTAADPFVDWLAAGIALTGLVFVVGAVTFVVTRHRTRRQVSEDGGTTATFWACAVYGGALTALVSSVIPLASGTVGGAGAAYLYDGDASARTGAVAGILGTALMIPLLASLGVGLIAGGEAVGEPVGGAILAGITIGSGLVAMAFNAGVGALGGLLASRFT